VSAHCNRRTGSGAPAFPPQSGHDHRRKPYVGRKSAWTRQVDRTPRWDSYDAEHQPRSWSLAALSQRRPSSGPSARETDAPLSLFHQVVVLPTRASNVTAPGTSKMQGRGRRPIGVPAGAARSR
jgi:hypothetical protein